MNPAVTLLLAATLAGFSAAASAATARIEFEKPESFTDAGSDRHDEGRTGNLDRLRDHFIRESARRLPAETSLHVWITDVDLAGDFEPTQRYSNEVRIVKDRYPPRIELRFRLARADGSTLKEGTRTLARRRIPAARLDPPAGCAALREDHDRSLARGRVSPLAAGGPGHSHSMVAGGFEEMS